MAGFEILVDQTKSIHLEVSEIMREIKNDLEESKESMAEILEFTQTFLNAR